MICCAKLIDLLKLLKIERVQGTMIEIEIEEVKVDLVVAQVMEVILLVEIETETKVETDIQVLRIGLEAEVHLVVLIDLLLNQVLEEEVGEEMEVATIHLQEEAQVTVVMHLVDLKEEVQIIHFRKEGILLEAHFKNQVVHLEVEEVIVGTIHFQEEGLETIVVVQTIHFLKEDRVHQMSLEINLQVATIHSVQIVLGEMFLALQQVLLLNQVVLQMHLEGLIHQLKIRFLAPQ